MTTFVRTVQNLDGRFESLQMRLLQYNLKLVKDGENILAVTAVAGKPRIEIEDGPYCLMCLQTPVRFSALCMACYRYCCRCVEPQAAIQAPELAAPAVVE